MPLEQSALYVMDFYTKKVEVTIFNPHKLEAHCVHLDFFYFLFFSTYEECERR